MTSKKTLHERVDEVAAGDRQQDEQPQLFNKKWWPHAILLAAGLLILSICAWLALAGPLAGLEQRIFEAINGVNLPAWVTSQAAKPVSNAVWGMVFLVVALLAIPKFRFLAWQYAVAAGSTYTVVFIIEHLVDRARPIGLTGYEVILRAEQGGPGFPSGHVAVLTALGLTIWPLVSWPWRLLIVALVAAEAWSRIFLGLHAPLDIVGGIAAAAVVVAIIHLTPAKIRKFFRVAA